MFLDHAAQRLDHARLRNQKQQRKRAVAAFVILGHQIVDGFVQQTGVCKCTADSATLLGRAIAQRVVDECRCLIRIHVVKIANGFLSHCGRRIVQQLRDLFKGAVRNSELDLTSLSHSGAAPTLPPHVAT